MDQKEQNNIERLLAVREEINSLLSTYLSFDGYTWGWYDPMRERFRVFYDQALSNGNVHALMHLPDWELLYHKYQDQEG